MVSFGEVTITSELNADPLTFNVTCTSMNGPVTSVAWTVNGSPVPNKNNPITTRTVDDTVNGTYTLTLSVTGILTGTYRCEVTSVRPEGIMVSPGMYNTSAEMTVSGEYNINGVKVVDHKICYSMDTIHGAKVRTLNFKF